MKLHILGNGGPRPSQDGKRFGTSCILELKNELIMFDCGQGTTYKMARMNLYPTQVNTLFITHHHSDHNVDFPCFSLLRFDLDNGELPPLEIYGPTPTESFVSGLVGEQGVFAPDIISRREHPVAQHNYLKRGGKLPRPEIKAQGHNIVSGALIETDTWKATALRVPHLNPFLISLAYRIDTEEGSVLYLGDAGINSELIELAKDADFLVTGILPYNTRLDPSDSHHDVSADIPDIIDLSRESKISKIVGIHGSPSNDVCIRALKEGYDGISYKGTVICPKELATVEL